jgi:hypothetical protein
VQAVVLLPAQRGGEGVLVVEFDRDGLAVIRADHRPPASVAEVRLQADTQRKRHQQNRPDNEENDGKGRNHGNTSRLNSRD